jgi:hypothetical protein
LSGRCDHEVNGFSLTQAVEINDERIGIEWSADSEQQVRPLITPEGTSPIIPAPADPVPPDGAIQLRKPAVVDDRMYPSTRGLPSAGSNSGALVILFHSKENIHDGSE